MNQKTIITFVIALLVVGGASFYGGMKYDQSKIKSNLPVLGQGLGGRGNFPGGAGGRRGAAGANGGFVNGQIIAKDDKSITIKSQDGGSKIVFLAQSTQITESVVGSSDDLAVGKNVVVNGSANTDGSLTGQIIQIRLPMPNATSTPNGAQPKP